MEIINHKDKYYVKTETGYREILVSTDSSLQFAIDKSPYPMEIHCLSQPSQDFIKIYIEEYNKGQQITEVLVEYEEY